LQSLSQTNPCTKSGARRTTTTTTTQQQQQQQQQQQYSLLSQASWGRLEMKPKRDEK
jgi:hypothetical protein